MSYCKLLILLLHLEQERRVATSTAEEDDVVAGAVVEGEESIASNPGEVQSKIQGEAKAGNRENESVCGANKSTRKEHRSVPTVVELGILV